MSKQSVEETYNYVSPWSTPQSLEWLGVLSSGNIRAQEIELAKCKQDPWHFILHWIQTEDAQNVEAPFQPFPNLIHLQVLTEYWMRERYLLVPKSRQLTITWAVSALYLWESLFFASRLTFFQSKKENDADANIGRAFTMYSRLPDWMRLWQPCSRTFCHLEFPRSRSEIKGIPAGADHVRGFTASGVFADEACFIDQLDETIAAVKPALGKTGKFTAVSSASPGTFQRLVYDLE